MSDFERSKRRCLHCCLFACGCLTFAALVLAALVFRPPMSGTPGPFDMALRHVFLGEAPSTSVSSEDLVHLGASTCTVDRAVPGKYQFWACAYLEPLWASASEAAVRCVDRAGVETLRTARSLVREGSSLSVVGNGGEARKDGALIDSADYVVRFNDFELNPTTGHRVDLHVMNGHVKRCRAPRGLVIECNRYRGNLSLLPRCGIEACEPTRASWETLCRRDLRRGSGLDSSRGFLATAILKRPNMRLFGFAGSAHYYDNASVRVTRVSHHVDLEHAFLKAKRVEMHDR